MTTVTAFRRRCLRRKAVDGDAGVARTSLAAVAVVVVAAAAVTRIELGCDAARRNLWCDAA